MEHVTKEIRNGFQFPFHPSDMRKMKGVVVDLQGVVAQSTLDEFGRSIPKHRPTHDQPFNFSEGKSINGRLDCD